MKIGLIDLLGMLLSGDTPEKIADRERRWKYHLEHEIPHSSDEISYVFMRRDFLDAVTKANLKAYAQRQKNH